MTKKNIIIISINIILFLFIIVYVFVDLSLYDHSGKDEINNIYDIKIKPNDNFVFLGDSITERYKLNEFYEDLPVVNSGIGGNTTDDILSSMNDRVYQYNPTKVFILIGINDLKQEKSVDYIYNNIVNIVNEIKKNRPYTKIYVESIYPINDSNDERISTESIKNRNNSSINKINKKLENKFKNTSVTYIDVNKELLDDEKKLKIEYTEDGVHLSPLGYIKVTKSLLPYLKN